MRLALAMRDGFGVSWLVCAALATSACNEVRVDRDDRRTTPTSGVVAVGTGAGGTGGEGGAGGGAPVACETLDGEVPACMLQGASPVTLDAFTDDTHYVSTLDLEASAGHNVGFVCAEGDVTLGPLDLQKGCYRFSSAADLGDPVLFALPDVAFLSTTSGSQALVWIAPGAEAYEHVAPPDRAAFGVLRADDSVPWMRPLYEGDAFDALVAHEGAILLSNGDVAVSTYLGPGGGGALDFGGGFDAIDDGSGLSAYVVRIDGATGETKAMHRFDVRPNLVGIALNEGPGGELSILFGGADEGSVEWWNEWYTWGDGEPVSRGTFEDVAPLVTPSFVDGAGRLWTISRGAVTRHERDGGCATVRGPNADALLYALDLAQKPDGSFLVYLLLAAPERDLDGCLLRTGTGASDAAFIAELTPDGRWLRALPVGDSFVGFDFLGASDDRALYAGLTADRVLRVAALPLE